jgi:hypothetical protein
VVPTIIIGRKNIKRSVEINDVPSIIPENTREYTNKRENIAIPKEI